MREGSDLVFWLALQRALFGRPLIANLLLKYYGKPQRIFRKVQISPVIKFGEWEQCERDLKYCEKENIEIVTLADPRYPRLLFEIPARPVLLMVKGDVNLLAGPCISIVGARKATSHGKQIAFEMGMGLAKHGFIVVSGMAYGIDAAAHLGALETGKTIAVWGSGIDCCYPSSFINLSERIIKSGCVVSEFPLGTQPFPQNFPQRNRIISGLSAGTVVVEAAAKSGSLITASFALEQGREIFAVPGPAGFAISAGTHDLLRNGATFAEGAEDIIAAISPQLTFGH